MSILKSVTDRIEDVVENAMDTLQELEKLLVASVDTVGKDDDNYLYENVQEASPQGNVFDDDEIEMREDQYNPLDSMAENIQQEIFSQSVGPETFKEHIEAFASAIAWKEPFILILLSFHLSVLILSVAIYRRESFNARVAMFCFIALVIGSAEWLNAYGAAHWQEWGITQDYFDGGGWFMAVMVCGPLLTVFVGMLLSMIWEAKLLITEVQMQKYRSALRKEKKRDKAKKE